MVLGFRVKPLSAVEDILWLYDCFTMAGVMLYGVRLGDGMYPLQHHRPALGQMEHFVALAHLKLHVRATQFTLRRILQS